MVYFFNETANSEIYTYGHTLSLHDAFPIWRTVTLTGAGLAGNQRSSPVNGSLPKRLALAGTFCTATLNRPGSENSPAPFLSTEPSRSEEHTSELQSLMRTSYAVFCLKKKKTT